MTKNSCHQLIRGPDLDPHPMMVMRLGPIKKFIEFNNYLLKIEIQEAKEHLRNAQEKLA